jgi:hypothetical protein
MGIRKHRIYKELPNVIPVSTTKILVTDEITGLMGFADVAALQVTVDGDGLATDADIVELSSSIATVINMIGVSGSTATQDRFFSTNNGNGTNYKVGDDVWIGDVNQSNTMQISGVQTSYAGYLKFGSGSNTPRIGTTGNYDLVVENANILASGIELTNGLYGQADISGSKVYATELFRLEPQNPLPYGVLGVMAVSGSHLYFHNGTIWNQVV